MTTTIVVGVDGGGTKTKVIVADAEGTQLATVTGPGSAVRPGTAEDSADVIESLIGEALAACGHEETKPAAICAGLAGVGRDAEYSAIVAALSRRELSVELEVLPDTAVALEDAFGDGPGILLIAGTGSSAIGRSHTGRLARCGGWGPICGDEGSGAWLGRRALSIITGAADGREPETALLGVLLTHLQMENPDELVAWAAKATPAKFAELSGPIMTVAANGDLRANSLCTMACEELVVHIRTLARQLFTDERAAIPIALAGGMMHRGSYLRRLVELRLKTAVPGINLHSAEVIPARGAVRCALRLAANA